MQDIQIVSFDVEGTLVTTDFSYAVWFEAIPARYAETNGIDIDRARKAVEEEYRKIGDQRMEWYDVQYWFDKLGLGAPAPAMLKCQNRIGYYPEVKEVIVSLAKRYKLIAASGSSGYFLNYLLKDIRHYFSGIYSSVSDYQQLKTPEFYSRICHSLGVEPGRIVHVGDNWEFDVVAPCEIGMRAFHLDRERRLNSKNSLSSLRELKIKLLE
jgi:HAD superfamily hydrolase (TIGR01549 family)